MAATTLNWFTSSLILSLFFLMHLRLKDFSAFAHHQQEIQIKAIDFGLNDVYAPHKEITTVVTREMRQLGGRKMMQVQDEASVLGREVNVDTPRISGANLQNEGDMNNENSILLGHTSHNDEDQMRERLDRETDKMLNLMHKDYNGEDKPRRKPPVNNDEPSD